MPARWMVLQKKLTDTAAARVRAERVRKENNKNASSAALAAHASISAAAAAPAASAAAESTAAAATAATPFEGKHTLPETPVLSDDLTTAKKPPPTPHKDKRRRIDSDSDSAIVHTHQVVDSRVRCPENVLVVQQLEELCNWHKNGGLPNDKHKVKNLGIVIMNIAALKVPTSELSDATLLQIPQLGPATLTKIREIEERKKLIVLETIITEEMTTKTELKRVHGIDTHTAQRLIAEAGIASMLDLERKVKSEDATVRSILTAAAWVGVENHRDISQRIPRYVVQIIGNAVIKVAKDLFPAVEGHICGSYRRGAPDSGDIDVLIAYDDAGPAFNLLALVQALKTRGIVCCDLTHMNANAVRTKVGTAKDDAAKKWMGLAVEPHGPTTKRRLDLLICPRSELPFQLIYLTGSEFLQRHLQTLAKDRGWKMSLHGFRIKKLDRGSKLVRVVGGTMLEPCKTEREVFERLQVEYLEPHERNMGNRKFTGWATASLGADTEEASGSDSEG